MRNYIKLFIDIDYLHIKYYKKCLRVEPWIRPSGFITGRIMTGLRASKLDLSPAHTILGLGPLGHGLGPSRAMGRGLFDDLYP